MNDSHNTLSSTNPETSDEALRQKFAQLAQCASDASDSELTLAATVMADLLTVAAMFREDSATCERANEIVEFCSSQALPALLDLESAEVRRDLLMQVETRWNDCLNLLAPDERFTSQRRQSWNESDETVWNGSVPAILESAQTAASDGEYDQQQPMDMVGILASLGSDVTFPSEPARGNQHLANVPYENDVCSQDRSHPRGNAELNPLPEPPADIETVDDPEMVAAFADDAQQCVAEMEASLLALETGHAAEESLRHFCRQLHTLKGASGTVGLSQLAGYLHNLENYVEKATDGQVNVDRLLQGVDAVRAQLAALGIAGDIVPMAATAGVAQAVVPSASAVPETAVAGSSSGQTRSGQSPVPRASGSGNDDEFFVRVEASRLERLMDLLAELVMLRNRRDTYVESMRIIHRELIHCASRSRALTSTIEMSVPTGVSIDDSSMAAAERSMSRSRLLSRTLDEVSNDTAELGRSLQEVFDPLSDDNSAVSHLIGRFRQELMELRRLPIGGLFQRLQRVIRDAARAEGKRVEITFEGQGARAERAVQERLFEPLLHLVRNAVSHGIDTQDERIRTGKPAAGRITLAAWSDATSLCIEVRDDGRGMNDEALELRGRALGLLPQGEAVSRSQLWNLIFHPGFSTKTSVSEISGRGVGMDVVNNWVRRLRGRIEVESVSGQGTTFRLQIPLRSAVEHAMVVEAGGQLFALPMHSISGTSDSKLLMSSLSNSTSQAHAVPLSRILGCRGNQAGRGCHIVLRDSVRNAHSAASAAVGNVTIVVDAIVGVEEVVVRSLPALLQRNELFAGVTLSGRAETVLLLDVRRVIDLSRPARQDHHHVPRGNASNPDRPPLASSDRSVLVVDDSVVVRRTLSKKLIAAGYDVRQAANGREAMILLNAGGIAAVITDLDMPGMTGVELMQEMKRQKQCQTIPVMVLSSRDADSMPPEVSQLQPFATLNKPVTDRTIKSIVDWLVGVSAVNA